MTATTVAGPAMSGSPANAAAKACCERRLEPVVELLGDPGLELGEQRLDVEPGGDDGEQPGQPGELVEVGQQRLAGAGVLDLDRDRAGRRARPPGAPGRCEAAAAGVSSKDWKLRRQSAPSSVGEHLVHGRGRHRRRRTPAAWSAPRGRAPASSSGSAASKTESAWPNFMAPPLSSPSTLKSCSAVRCCSSVATTSAAPADALAEAERGPAGDAQREAGDLGRTGDGAARDVGPHLHSASPSALASPGVTQLVLRVVAGRGGRSVRRPRIGHGRRRRRDESGGWLAPGTATRRRQPESPLGSRPRRSPRGSPGRCGRQGGRRLRDSNPPVPAGA